MSDPAGSTTPQPKPLKGLTLTQPWASLIAVGAKEWETRGWPTGYRGAVLIHSSRNFPGDAREFAGSHPLVAPLLPQLRDPFEHIALGCVVAIARLTDCVRTTDLTQDPARLTELERSVGNFEPGRFAFRFTHVRKLHPIPWRGALSLWEVPVDLRRLVVAQLASTPAASGAAQPERKEKC